MNEHKWLRRAAILLIELLLLAGVSSAAQAQSAPCGKWEATGQDARLQIQTVDSGSGPDCAGSFSLTNGTQFGFELGLIKVKIGGYTYLSKLSADNAIYTSPWNLIGLSDTVPAIPGHDVKFIVWPKDRTVKARLTVSGSVNLVTSSIDASMFFVSSLLSKVPTNACGITQSVLNDVLRSVAVDISPGLMPTTSRAAMGDLKGAKAELSHVGKDLVSSVVSSLASKGLGCLAQLVVEAVTKTASVIPTIAANYVAWAPGAFFTYFKYQGFDASTAFIYTPPTQPSQPPPAPCAPGPELFSPPNGYTTYAKNTIFRWRGYTLNNGEYFELYVKAEGDLWRNPGGEIKQHPGEFYLEYNDFNSWNRGKYYWEVRAKRSDGSYATCEPNPPPSFTLIEKDTTPVPPSAPSSSSSSWSSWSTGSY